MTVSTTQNKIIYDGDGSTTVWPFVFPAVSEDDLEIYFTDTDGTVTELSSTLYTVILNAAISPNPTAVGGSVTYPLSGSPIAVDTFLTILRALPETQETSLADQGVLYPKVIEEELDYLTMLIQDMQELLGRQITVAVSDPDPEPLPAVSERADLWAAFDSDGNMIAAAAPDGVVAISSAMIPVVEAASLALARTAMGLGDMAAEDIGAGLQDDSAGAVRVNNTLTTDTINQSVTSAFHQTQRIATGPITYTLPRANTLWNGFGFYIFTQTGLITFAIDANDAFGNQTAGVSFYAQPGSWVRVTTDAASSGKWYAETHLLGPALASGAQMLNGALTEAHAVNATTYAIKTLAGNDPSTMDPVLIVFRSATPGTGAPVLRVLTTALNITIPSTATMGFTSAVAGRVWLAALDNAGTVELAVINCRNGINIYPLRGWGIITTTILNTASDTAAVPYSAAARTAVAYSVLGYFGYESGLTTAGTWDASPTRIQAWGPGVPLPGDQVQVQRNITGAVATGNTVMPGDDTIPQITEGDEYMTQVIVPTSAANLLETSWEAFFTGNGAALIAAGLFQDAIANALAVMATVSAASGNTIAVSGLYVGLAGTSSSLTMRLRVGANAPTTLTFNGAVAARLYGGVVSSFLQVKEIMA